jgi:hypothetical protein
MACETLLIHPQEEGVCLDAMHCQFPAEGLDVPTCLFRDQTPYI